MHFDFYPNPGKPNLICVPGLLGGPEDFRAILTGIEDQFQILFVDPNRERKDRGLARLSLEETQAVSYDSSAEEIASLLTQHGIESAYFMGVSLGGKIVYDFAIRFPQLFLGGVITDVAPSSFVASELYQFVDRIATNTDLNLTWAEVKEQLRQTVHDRNLRSLIQSQISYPHLKPPGLWKTGMKGLRTLLQANSIDDQSEAFEEAHPELVRLGRQLKVCQATRLSGITEDAQALIETKWPCIELIRIPDAAHFLHITHQHKVREVLFELIRSESVRSGLLEPGKLRSEMP